MGVLIVASLVSIQLFGGADSLSYGKTFLSYQDGDVEEKIKELEESINQLDQQVLKVGIIRPEETFTVFSEAVKEERERVKQKEEEIVELRRKASKEEVSEKEYRHQNDVLQAEHLQARLNVDLAMIDTMIEAKGFKEISEDLKEIREKTEPIQKELSNLITDIEEKLTSPQEATNKLNNLHSQFQELDQLVTRVLDEKAIMVTHDLAKEQNYDLVIRPENVVVYGNLKTIKDFTEEVKGVLEKELH